MPPSRSPTTGAGTSNDPIELATWLARIETASVLDERRRALAATAQMVSGSAQCVAQFKPSNVAMLVEILRHFSDSDDFVTPTLEILLAVATAAVDGPPGSSAAAMNNGGQRGSSSPFANASAADVLKAMSDVSLLVTNMRNGDFWCRYNTVSLLAKLHRGDPAGFGAKILATPNGVADLVDVLNDSSNGGALRDEGLLLFMELTGPHANEEVKSILAFENCFESLFTIVKEEGGPIAGSVIARDCIAITQNMIRGNKNTQRFFRDMGCARELTKLLETDFFAGAGGAAVSSSGAGAPSSPIVPDAQSMEIMKAVVATVQIVLEGADSNGEGAETRTVMTQCGVPAALSSYVFATLPNLRTDDGGAAEVEALRTLTRLIAGCKAASDVVKTHTVRRQGADSSALWVALLGALTDNNADRQAASARLVYGVIASSSTDAAQLVVRNLSPRPGPGAACGQLLGPYLFAARKPTAATHNIACLVTAACVASSMGLADQIVTTAWDGDVTFFAAFISYTMDLLRSRRATIPDISAALRVLIFAIRGTPKALVMMLSDASRLRFFAEWAVSCPDGVHIKFMCACLVALAALKVREVQLPPTSRLSVEEAIALFTGTIKFATFRNLYDAVSNSDEWTHAPRGMALAELPKQLVYDGRLVNLFSEIFRAVEPLGDEQAAAVSQQQQHKQTLSAPASVETSPNTQQQPAVTATPATTAPASPASAVPATTTAPTTAETVPVRDEALVAELAQAKERELAAAERAADLERRLAEAERAASEAAARADAAEAAEEARRKEIALAEEARHELEQRAGDAEARAEMYEGNLSDVNRTIEALEARLRGTSTAAEENDELRAKLAEAEADRDELLLLVAELDEFTAVHGAEAASNPPAADFGDASPDVK